ncbi:MAG: twin-arginine translocase subunit TatC [Anaerolineales bacterium]|nr:twin-arginine translocase subunit TatC [Anaerolineales bacterium]MDW8160958.1 twin-arginine translocase subunit TatC [Anaerolineales bacterium]
MLVFRWTARQLIRWAQHTYETIHFLLTEEEEDVPIEETLSKTIQNPSGIFEHIDALRRHLFRALVALVITTSVSFVYTPQIVDFLAKPIGGLQELVAIDVTEPIGVFMRVALLTGFTAALPYIVFELWLFVAPGLKKRTRLGSLLTIPIATALFFAGMAFAYFVLLPVGIPWLTQVMGIRTEVRPSSYIHFVTTVLFWIGMAFEFPLLIYFFALVGLVRAQTLLDQWRFAVVVISILAATITPTIDPINMGLVMLPMVILYFISIGLAYLAERSRRGQVTPG